MQVSLVAFFVIVIDQWTKSVVAHGFALSESRPIVPGLFSLTYVRNSGGAFGIMPGSGMALIVTGSLVSLGIAAVLLGMKSAIPLRLGLAMALPLGGTIGNLIDRIRQGYVVDFFDVFTGVHHWPVFNIADSSICLGLGLLALWLNRSHETAPETRTAVRGEN